MSDFETEGGGLVKLFGELAGGANAAVGIGANGGLKVEGVSGSITGHSVEKTNATGNAAIAASAVVAAGALRRVVSVSVHFGVAPAAAGSLTITLNAAAGAAYDTLLATQSMVGVIDFLWQPSQDIYLAAGDSLDVAYANADGRTYGAQITLEVA